MSNNVILMWSELHTCTVTKEKVFQALLDIFNEYSAMEYNHITVIIEWLQDNLECYLGEFLNNVDFIYDSDLDIDEQNFTALLEDPEFINEFKEWLNE